MEAEKKKATAAKSMETAREAGYFGKKLIKNAHKAHLEGRPVGWSMVTWYEGELISKAMGLELLFPENYGAFCGASRQAEPYLERSDRDGFPTSLCGYARNSLGYASFMAENDGEIPADAPAGGMPKPVVLIGSGATCDARFKWFQGLKRYLDVPQWTLELPWPGVEEFFLPEHKAKSIRFMVNHLKKFVSFLEGLLGKKMDWDKLEEIVDMAFKTLGLAHEVDLLRRAVPSPMVSQDFWAIMLAHFYLPYDPEAYEFNQRVYNEVKSRVDSGTGAIPNEKYRMLFAELPPWHSLGFFDKLAENYGIAMVYESFGYHAPSPIPEEELQGISDPLERIARLTYQKFTDTNEFAQENDVVTGTLVAPFVQAAYDYRADGLFCHPLMSCRAATYTLLNLKDLLENRLKVPGVVVNGDIVDLRLFNEEEALSKTEAFVETMDHFREERKKAGMAW
ncbi:MAG: 2-hydroxyacyl-CoA dehydratase family protein [Desulfobacterales bacterium]|jgi:benzoyl-CoA reductase/2-hydroxyglutaryl-CoA dehydratase subunit BcrC/BadD/HgdB